jgi:hypothetical protein
MQRWRCTECGWIGSELLTAPNPFDPEDVICGCPECRSVDDFEPVCDEVGCDKDATSGWPSPTGYRWTCHNHSEIGQADAVSKRRA